ncbi:hypothetical protein C0J52_23859, partial [Blattella germanica]
KPVVTWLSILKQQQEEFEESGRGNRRNEIRIFHNSLNPLKRGFGIATGITYREIKARITEDDLKLKGSGVMRNFTTHINKLSKLHEFKHISYLRQGYTHRSEVKEVALFHGDAALWRSHFSMDFTLIELQCNASKEDLTLQPILGYGRPIDYRVRHIYGKS